MGVKVWVCADVDTVYIYNFRVYTGKSATKLEHGLAYGVVMNLLEDVMDSGRTLYTDNFYSSPVLFQDLYDQGIYATGTCRSNKIHFPKSILPSWTNVTGSGKRYVVAHIFKIELLAPRG